MISCFLLNCNRNCHLKPLQLRLHVSKVSLACAWITKEKIQNDTTNPSIGYLNVVCDSLCFLLFGGWCIRMLDAYLFAQAKNWIRHITFSRCIQKLMFMYVKTIRWFNTSGVFANCSLCERIHQVCQYAFQFCRD